VPGNVYLAARMAARGLSHAELAEQVNDFVEALTGRRGAVSDRTVRRYLSGQTRWPQGRQRAALEAVFGCTAEELGFAPPAGQAPKDPAAPRDPRHPQEDPLHRRTLLTATAGTALTAALPAATRYTIGTADVQHLTGELAALWQLDDREGGGGTLESRALALSSQVMDLQQRGSATGRVRSRLYALAASFTAAAMFAAVDARELARAQRHMESAITLAGLSGDGQVQHQTWRYATMLADQRGRHADASAAAEAAMSTSAHRADPLYASIGHARLALALPGIGEQSRALRALGRAADAFERADTSAPRPSSMQFYTRGELDGLTGVTQLRLRRAEQAEYHLYRCLSALRPDQHRNRALYTAYLALAQLEQDEPERACATAHAVAVPAGSSGTGRTQHLLQVFTTRLTDKAPGAALTRAWNQHARTL
jgi:hypothetical protein